MTGALQPEAILPHHDDGQREAHDALEQFEQRGVTLQQR